MRVTGLANEIDKEIDFSLPDDLAYRRSRGEPFFQAMLYVVLAQMTAVVLYLGLLQIQ